MVGLADLDAKGLHDQRRKLQARHKRRLGAIKRAVADRQAIELGLFAVESEIARRRVAAQKKTVDELQRAGKGLRKPGKPAVEGSAPGTPGRDKVVP